MTVPFLSFINGVWDILFEYGHEFNKNFDVAIDIGGQFNSLETWSKSDFY